MEELYQPQSHGLHPHKVVIIGAGQVGATFAYALLLSGLVGRIVLIDLDRKRAEGEVMDLNHGVPLSNPVRIWVGDYADCTGADLVVITAGATQRPGEKRLDLLERNAQVMRQIVPHVIAYTQSAVLLITTNPVDVISAYVQRLSGLPAGQVIGSGTILDTARFRFLLGEHFGIDPHSVQAYIVGEHGDSEVAVWSNAEVAGMKLNEFCQRVGCELSAEERLRLFEQTRDAGYNIMQSKGATYYAVALGLLRITESILRDQRTVLTVSGLVPGHYGIQDVYLSLPAVVGRQGIERMLHVPLNDEEEEKLFGSAGILKEKLRQMQ